MEALKWWAAVLQENITEERSWQEPKGELCHVFVDAASTPSRVAAVLMIDGDIWYTDAEPDWWLMQQLQDRGDKQITSLVSVGLFPLGIPPYKHGSVPTGDYCCHACPVHLPRPAPGQEGIVVLRQLW